MSAVQITEKNFEEEILKSDIPVLVDFGAEWCGPCKMMGPIVDELAISLEGKAKMAKVDIDEAQMLQTRELMEEFRGLLNLEIPDKKLLNIVFFGLPELDEVMKLDAPLAQRVAFKYTLKPLSTEATLEYIDYRLQVAGCEKSPFNASALVLIDKFSGGVPRLINTICDNALFETFLRHGTEITAEIINNVVEDLGLASVGLTLSSVDEEDDDELDDIEIIFDGLEKK